MPDQKGPRHSYKRDSRMPDWHGWHAPRRGLGNQSLSVKFQSKFHLERCRGGAWTLQMKDRHQKDLELSSLSK